MSVKKWITCAFLFFVCYLIIMYLDKTIENFRGGGGRGYGGMGRGRGGIGRGYYGGYGYNPVYIYDDSNYRYSYPYWYSYIPFFNSYY